MDLKSIGLNGVGNARQLADTPEPITGKSK